MDSPALTFAASHVEVMNVSNTIEIEEVEQVAGYGLVVSFTDGTLARYTIEELIELRPYREQLNGTSDA